jgi:hypothetical protein
LNLPAFLIQASRSGPALREVKSMPLAICLCMSEEVLMTRAGVLVSL